MLIGMRNAMLAGGGSQPSGGYWGLCFTAEESNSTVAMVRRGTNPPEVSLLYSADAVNWLPFVVDETTVTLANVGDKIWLKAGSEGNTAFGSGSATRNQFSLTGKIAASGSIQSLLNGEEETFTAGQSAFLQMFRNCTSLTAAPTLPATTVGSYAYRFMFGGCTGLVEAPVLPATAPGGQAYYSLFNGCTNLTSIRTAQTSEWEHANMTNWVRNVAATGTFYCPTALGTNATITRGVSACPEGWTVINTDA